LKHTQESLRQSQKLEAIGQLTGGVAHDFNNLLMAVLSSLTLLRKRVPDDPALHRLIDNAVQGAERGATLTQRMLAFARRQDLTTENVDLRSLVVGMTGLLERTLGPGWPVSLDLDASLPPVLADPNQIEMALINLAVNARDAMVHGGAVQIGTPRREVTGSLDETGLAAGLYVGLRVSDTGHGMDAATLERATEPFFTTKGPGKGTGLGLPMIHGLAKQLGGAFELQSQVGRGTTATLWLPAAAQDTAEAVAEPVSSDERPAQGMLKVLAVDDDALVLMNTVDLLEDLGHKVIEAYSGSDALELLRAHPDIDLLITDQAMPGMTGAQLVQQVTLERPELPIILATGYGELPPGFKPSVIKLSKPFTQDFLEAAMLRALAEA
jgi:CheY-like chemotaxis protein